MTVPEASTHSVHTDPCRQNQLCSQDLRVHREPSPESAASRSLVDCRVCFPLSVVQVYPIQGFPDQEICDVSTKMINEHINRFSSNSRILQQV